MANEIARALRRRLTPQEARLWLHLRALRPQGIYVRRQVPIGRFIVDFACLKAKLVVEIDGAQHGIGRHQADDVERDRALAVLGFNVLRFWNIEVDRSIIAVVDTVFAEASVRQRSQ